MHSDLNLMRRVPEIEEFQAPVASDSDHCAMDPPIFLENGIFLNEKSRYLCFFNLNQKLAR